MQLNQFLLIVLAMSLLTFVLYYADKFKAKHNQWRIKEHTLLACGILLGAFGALIAMYTIRHKNKKWYFVLINSIALIFHIGIAIYLAIN